MTNFKFYLFATLNFLIIPILSFFTGIKIFHEFLLRNYGEPKGGEEVLGYAFYTGTSAFISFLLGILISLIIIHKLARRYGSQLSFGSHPVLKLTGLAFLTFLGLLFLLLLLYPSKEL